MKKVMVVEDEILVRVGLKSFFNWEESGYLFCAEASDGREALEKIEEVKPDIILTDLKMSGMNGFELIKTCRKKYPKIHFIVLSSYNDFDNVREAMKLGADDYIFKLASSPENLLKTLDEVSEKINSEMEQEEKKNSLQMDDFITKNASTLKRNFISDAIQGNVLNIPGYFGEFSKILQLKVSFEKPYHIMYLSIDENDAIKGSQDEEGMFKTSVENIIQKAVESETSIEVFNYERNDFVLIIQKESQENAEEKKDMQHIFEMIYLYVKRYAGTSISGYVGQECCGLKALKEITENMRRRLYKRLPCENGTLNFYMDNMREEIAYIEKYIRANLDKELTVASVAQVANMSESYFSHVFKKEMGESFTNYVNHVRINQAKELLLKSDLRINEIATEVGLENANYFSTLFKKITGKSPNQFRGKS